MMVNYLAVYTESKNDSPGFSIWNTYQQALNAKVPQGMVLWDIMAVKDDATFGAETFEAPRRKKLDFVWIGEDSSEKEWARIGRHTIDAAIKKAKAEGWKPVMSEYWGDNPATKKSRMRREAKVWNLMSKSPQWKPWLKFLTERNADNEMHETMDIFRGKAYWKDKNRNSVSILGRTQNHGPWIYDEDRIYVPDHFSEDGGWQVLVKGNQALLLYYIADFDGPYSTPLMRKTFNLSPVKATKTAKKAKPKAKKTTTRKAKPKAAKKLTAKTGRKAPTISATRRKIGTRMRGNNGKMWEVKKSGKSQRWMAGAEGVVYTGDYQTNDNYNPYKYVNEAPFGAEEKDLYSRLETEPLNMKGAAGMFIAIVGILLWKA